MATSPLAIWAAAIGLFLVFQTCWAQQGVCYRQVSHSQSYASGVSQSYRTCTRNWFRRRCSTRYRTSYVARYRTGYSSQFACCSGYIQHSTQCFPVDCGTLTIPANSQVIYSGRTTFGHTATYSCHTGYSLVGGSTRTCQATRMWSGSAPTCQPVNCYSLTNPANGRVSYSAGTTFGQAATYSCNTGYSLVGGSTRICQATGVWSGSAPTCQPICSCQSWQVCVAPNTCRCPTGFTGSMCRTPLCQDCDSNHTCTAPNTCVCPSGWTGSDCHTDIDECEGNIVGCEHNCVNIDGHYSCTCESEDALATDLHNCLAPPQNISLAALTSTTLLLRWEPPEEDPGDGTILHYSIVCRFGDSDSLPPRNSSASGQSFRITDLHPFTNYNCCVSAQRTNGDSPESCSSETTPEDVPSAPAWIIVANFSSHALLIEWSPPSVPNGIVTAYTIYIDYNNGTSEVEREMDPSVASYLLEGLSPFQLVGVQVTANTSVGEGPRSNIIDGRTNPAASTAVTELTVQITSSSSLQISWEPPEMLNGILAYYELTITSEADGSQETWRIQYNQSTEVNVTGLEPYVPYNVEIIPLTLVVGQGGTTRQIFFTKEGVPSVAPMVVGVRRTTATTATLNWSQLSLVESRGFLTAYKVTYKSTQRRSCPQVDPETSTTLSVDQDETQLVISDLDPRLEYCVGIAASTVAGTSDYSATLKVPLFANSLFQIYLSGIHMCSQWVHDDSLEKLSDVTEQIVLQLTDSCECALTVEYIADGRLVCDPNEPEKVIFQGRIISTPERNSTDFLPMLKSWKVNEPTIVVQGVQLKVESRCPVELATLGDTQCVQPPTDSVVASNFPVPEKRSNFPIPEVAGGVGGALVLVVLVVVIVAAIICVKKLCRGKGEKNIENSPIQYENENTYAEIMNEEYESNTQETK